MFGIEMLLKAIGMDDAAIAELRALIDPAHLKTQIQAARDEYAKVRADLDEIKSLLRDLRAHQGLTEIVAHGGQVLHPNFQKNLDDQLQDAAERGDVAFVIEGECGHSAPCEPLEIPPWLQHLKRNDDERRNSDDTASAGSDGSGSGSGG
jgi:hypothetical protein